MPGALPPGETILWQAAPNWRSLALHLCHIRAAALYLGATVLGSAALMVSESQPAGVIATTILPLVGAGLGVLAFLGLLAWWVARTTEYTLTSHRLVMRLGVALPATLAIPHRAIASVALHQHGDGTGDLPIEMKPTHPVAYRRVWPHARPWRLVRAQPMLRSVPNAAAFAPILAEALAGAGATYHRPSAMPPRTDLLPTAGPAAGPAAGLATGLQEPPIAG